MIHRPKNCNLFPGYYRDIDAATKEFFCLVFGTVMFGLPG